MLRLKTAYAGLTIEAEKNWSISERRLVHGSQVLPAKVKNPSLLAWSVECAKFLGLPNFSEMSESEKASFVALFSGNVVPEGVAPIALRYGGHQFGHWAGQLGDGRAITIGATVVDTIATKPNGLVATNAESGFEIQLKGAGQTPYSRRGDGRAVLRSSVREYLCSESMHFLGIPTTRALALLATGEGVVRDMFYDGNPAVEPGAIVVRVAPTFLRFGNFQIHAATGESDRLRELMAYVLGRPDFTEMQVKQWFSSLVKKTADLVIHWMRVGFVHAVMNTDNLSILGITIDYGPYGWLDIYDPGFTPNTTDSERRRYCFENQPDIAYWNLSALAMAIKDLNVSVEPELAEFSDYFSANYLTMKAAKIGFSSKTLEGDSQSVKQVIVDLESLLTSCEIDMTIFYRSLAHYLKNQTNGYQDLLSAYYTEHGTEPSHDQKSKLTNWLRSWVETLNQTQENFEKVIQLIESTNPVFIPRNYLVQEVVEELIEDKLDREFDRKLDKMKRFENAMKTPYELNESTLPYFKKLPDWARDKPGCSALSCSS